MDLRCVRRLPLVLCLAFGICLVAAGCGRESRPAGPPWKPAGEVGAVPRTPTTEEVAAEEAAEKLPETALEKVEEAAEEATETVADMAETEKEEVEPEEEGGLALDLVEGESKSVAPFVPTPQDIVEAMLSIAEVKAGDVVYDLGSGDGRVIITAAQKFGAKAVGVELNKELYEKTVKRIQELGLLDKVTVKNGDLREEDVSPATVVSLYLMPDANEALKDRLKSLLKPGSRVVSHDFSMPDWEPAAEKSMESKEDGFHHTIYLYKL